MRNPLSKALWSIGFAIPGAGLVLVSHASQVPLDETTAAIFAIIGVTLAALIDLVTFLWVLSSVGGIRGWTSARHCFPQPNPTAGPRIGPPKPNSAGGIRLAAQN